jgi:putative aminopeptidase FrvX
MKRSPAKKYKGSVKPNSPKPNSPKPNSIEIHMRDIFSNPTAPYREQWVLNCIQRKLKAMRVPYFKDEMGNIVAGVSGARQLGKSKKLALVAHTDHPGFHLIEKLKPGLWKARWLGGAPPKVKGSTVAVYNPRFPHAVTKGTIKSDKVHGNKDSGFLIEIGKKYRQSSILDASCFGTFDFSGYRRRGNRISTRAADDLAGVAIILSTFERLSPKERRNMVGIFTRAEEIGFRGAIGIIESGILGPQHKIISLEASRQMDGARIGRGPIIRLGDKKTLFDSGITARLDGAAAELSKRDRGFKTQRRIMNGGTCEATVFNLNGIPSSGLAVPLGNYHNQRRDGRPGAEFIDIRDVERAVDLCVQVFRDMAGKNDPMGSFLKLVHREFRKDIRLLKAKLTFAERET